MGAAARIGMDVGLIVSDEFTARCRTSPEAFTRRRKMPAGLLVESVVARKGRTLKIELREFARERGMESPISAPGYSKAREKLNPGALLYLAQRHAANVYADGDFEAYKGMLLVAIDGSTATVPTTPETLERYGDASARGKSQATMGLSGAFDVINRQLLNITINRGGFDERAQVPAHLGAIPGVVGDLAYALLLDRGYPSFALMADLIDAGVPFVIRCPASYLKPEFKAAAESGGDLWARVELTCARMRSLKGDNRESWERLRGREALEVRCALVDIGGEQPERLITSIPADALSLEELKEVYHLRWGVETCFQMLKDRLQMENMSGTRPALIEQDVYAAAYLLNVAFDMANEADSEARATMPEGRYKHEMTVSRSLAIGILKDELIRLVLADAPQREEMMSAIAAELGRNLVPIRRSRSYSREGLKTNKANRYSNTHKRVF